MPAKIAPPNPAPTATSIGECIAGRRGKPPRGATDDLRLSGHFTGNRQPRVPRRRDRANLLVQYSEQRRLICNDLAHPEPRAGGPGHEVSNATHAYAPHQPLGSLSDVGWALRAQDWHQVISE
jgi:hypothetical protein